MKCPKHPKYKAIKEPKVNCVWCWNMYIRKSKTPDKAVKHWDDLIRSLQIC